MKTAFDRIQYTNAQTKRDLHYQPNEAAHCIKWNLFLVRSHFNDKEEAVAIATLGDWISMPMQRRCVNGDVSPVEWKKLNSTFERYFVIHCWWQLCCRRSLARLCTNFRCNIQTTHPPDHLTNLTFFFCCDFAGIAFCSLKWHISSVAWIELTFREKYMRWMSVKNKLLCFSN